jgi:hypothetical protein
MNDTPVTHTFCAKDGVNIKASEASGGSKNSEKNSGFLGLFPAKF